MSLRGAKRRSNPPVRGGAGGLLRAPSGGPRNDTRGTECRACHFPALRLSAAPMNAVKSGCGLKGRDLNSGWNWHPTNQG